MFIGGVTRVDTIFNLDFNSNNILLVESIHYKALLFIYLIFLVCHPLLLMIKKNSTTLFIKFFVVFKVS